ncbi:MAG: NUDIX domain-containing protein [Alphaproteobacteria bacterium]
MPKAIDTKKKKSKLPGKVGTLTFSATAPAAVPPAPVQQGLMDVVDERDNVLRQTTWDEIKTKNLRYRIVHVIVVNNEGQMLVQLRHRNKNYAPGKFEASAAGKVDAGESYEQAAYRELQEELGITGVKLKEIGGFGFDGEHTCNGMLYVADYTGDVSGWEAEAEIIDSWDFDEASMMLDRFPYLLADGFQVSLSLLFQYMEEKTK